MKAKKILCIWGAALVLLSAGCAVLKSDRSTLEVPVVSSAAQDLEETFSISQEQVTIEEYGNAVTMSPEPAQTHEEPAKVVGFINSEGVTLKERIRVPEGYSRVSMPEGSFGEFVEQYPMCPDQSPVLLYTGVQKGNQSAHMAVFDLPVISDMDLQQCADSVMRMYAEYLWQTDQYDKIRFHFVNGFLFDYSTFLQGNRPSFSGNSVSWKKTASYDTSYEAFERYLFLTFAYSSTLSMEGESEPAQLEDVTVGNVFLRGGSPGHVVMVADVCQDAQGRKAFLLAQGYMPAQQFHILKNPLHEEDPWYYVDEISYPLRTPEYTFEEGSYRRMTYLD